MASKTYEVRLTANNSELIRKLVEAGDATEHQAKRMSSSVDTHSGKIRGTVSRLGDDLKARMPKLGGLVEGIGGAFAGIPGPVGIAAGAITGAVTLVGGVLMSAVGHAEAYQAVHEQLVVALKNSHTTWAAQKDIIDKVEASSRQLGFTDGETESALTVMTRGMGSSKQALADLGVAQDLARAKNIDLSDAALIVTRASEGQLRPLKQLGIDLPIAAAGALKVQQANDKLKAAQENLVKTIGKIHDGFIKGPAAIAAYQKAQDAVKLAQDHLNTVSSAGHAIIGQLSDRLKGSATAAAGGYEGAQRDLHAQLDHVQRIIGEKVLPMLVAVELWIANKGIPWLEAIAKVVGPVFQAWVAAMSPVIKGLSTIVNLTGQALNMLPGFGGGGSDFNTALAFMRAKTAPSFYGPPPTHTHARAAGGPVRRNMPYLVGESGMEMFVPDVGGTIVPNHALANMGGGNVYVTITGPVLGANAQYDRQLALAIQNQLNLLAKR